MLYVLVTMVIKEGRMQEFLALCAELRPQVLREQGCLAYDYTRETASPIGIQEPLEADRITLIERWESMDALRAHLETPHMKEAGPRMRDLRASVTARIVEPVF